jgi:Alpha/beta hydrolase domain
MCSKTTLPGPERQFEGDAGVGTVSGAAAMRRGWLIVAAVVVLASMATSCSTGSHGYTAGPLRQSSDSLYRQSAAFTGTVTVGHVVEPETAHTGPLPTGYSEQEFFVTGTSSAFEGVSEPADGRWVLKPSTSAGYKTRILVRRPTDPSRFNGTVVVEWMNVSSGESSPDWDYLNPALSDAGFAYVAVSAQTLGVNGGQSILGASKTTGLVQQEPARYGTLHVPGDQYSLDIFAQIGRGLRLPQNRFVLGGLTPTHIVAVGESQSAFYLTTFVNAIQPLTHAYDGFFIHSRGGTGAPLDGSSITGGGIPNGQRIRTDLDVPVFMFETQTDLIELGYASAQQPNTKLIRTWEVAGTSHADTWIVGNYASQLGCPKPINSGPQHQVVQAAFIAFGDWVSKGQQPPSPPRLDLASTNPAVLALDSNGNALGGVRTPAVDVPISTLSGAAPPDAKPLCALFGSTTPFSTTKLVPLYHDQSNYISLYTHDLDRTIHGGFILENDRNQLIQQAHQVSFSS